MIDTTIGRPAVEIEVDEGRSESAVSWAAVIGGAVAASAITLIVFSLGVGLGLSGISPWPGASASATTLTVGAAIWLVVMQWISAAIGGYLAGRLRTRSTLPTDEVHFRDTAHGFLAWALATVLVVAVLSTAMAVATVGGSMAAGAAGAAGAAAAASASQTGTNGSSANSASGGSALNPVEYRTDELFRGAATGGTAGATSSGSAAESRDEALRILMMSARNGDVSAEDRAYLARLVAARTGLSQADADKRVDQVIGEVKDDTAKVKEAADKARKASAGLSILIALSLVVGAFVGSVAGAYGGHHREEFA